MIANTDHSHSSKMRNDIKINVQIKTDKKTYNFMENNLFIKGFNKNLYISHITKTNQAILSGVSRGLFLPRLYLLVLLATMQFFFSDAYLMAESQAFTTRTAKSSQKNNLLHPTVEAFNQKDANYFLSQDSATINNICIKCHDSVFIGEKSSHMRNHSNINCLHCHIDFIGNERLNSTDITSPGVDACGRCHGYSQSSTTMTSLPLHYSKHADISQPPLPRLANDITKYTGTIFNGNDISNSGLNLENKSQLKYPWDIHARRGVFCNSCHVLENDFRRNRASNNELEFLKFDHRKITSISDYLSRPDHTMITLDCLECHDPLIVHDKLPYKERHLSILSCQTCHVQNIYGPALFSVDHTVASTEGYGIERYRGYDSHEYDNNDKHTMIADEKIINTRLGSGYQPFLLSNLKTKKSVKKEKIAAYNIFTIWEWREEDIQTGIHISEIKDIFLIPKDEDHTTKYRKEILHEFDANRDGNLSVAELQIDSEQKYSFVQNQLKDKGFKNPSIQAVFVKKEIGHGMSHSRNMAMDCDVCHGQNSKFAQDIILSSFVPFGAENNIKMPDFLTMHGYSVINNNQLRLIRDTNFSNFYIFGTSRIDWLDILGLLMFVFSAMGVVAHTWLRLRANKFKTSHHHGELQKVYMYSLYERTWHWIMALSIILLVVSGLEIHYTGEFSIFGLALAVKLHNVMAFIVVVNAVFSLFYHIATGEIKQFFSFSRDFLNSSVLQATYYIYGIFHKAPHPIAKTVKRKLNPIQQITYVLLLNVLLTFQIITGAIIWAFATWPEQLAFVKGMHIMGPLHNFGSWMILTFMVVHVYMTSTGHTPMANIKAMITGIDEIAIHDSEYTESFYRNISIKEVLMNVKRILQGKDVDL